MKIPLYRGYRLPFIAMKKCYIAMKKCYIAMKKMLYRDKVFKAAVGLTFFPSI